jgi:N-acetylglucosamine-6-phosphate deacetylase
VERVLRAGRVLSGDASTGLVVLDDGWIVVRDGLVVAVGEGRRDDGLDVVDLVDLGPDATIVAGFVDIHMHGGGGHDVTGGAGPEISGAFAYHRSHGTTTSVVSLVTAAVPELVRAMGSIAEWASTASRLDREAFAGIHLEGPFLAAARCGAQNPRQMCDPTPDAVETLIEAGEGRLVSVTIAPERPGALAAIERFVAAGVVVAIGHTDASTEATVAAIDAGARLATHLGNAMPPLTPRQPGPVGACLADPRVACELIVDGHHLHPSFVRATGAAKGDGRGGAVLVTDAIAAAGAPEGRYTLGELDVDVRGGVARLVEGGALAGSTLTMDVAVANAAGCGWTLADAVTASSLWPARVLGLHDRGAIVPGRRADLVVLDDDWRVTAILVAGDAQTFMSS